MLEQARGSVTIPNLLAGHWSFDDNSAWDSSPRGNHGVLTTTSGVNKPVFANGQINGALSFNGATSLITLPKAIAQGQLSITLTAWIKGTSFAATGGVNAVI